MSQEKDYSTKLPVGHGMRTEDLIRALALIESAALLGILSALLTWFVGRPRESTAC